MFETVIVPLDGSPRAEAVVPDAAEEAARHGATLVLMRVVPRPEPVADLPRRGGPARLPPTWPAAEIAAAQHEADRYLGDVVRRYNLTPDAEVVIPVGDPATRLLAEARHRPRPLVVLPALDSAGGPVSGLNGSLRRLLLDGAAPVLAVQPAPAARPAPARTERASVRGGFRHGTLADWSVPGCPRVDPRGRMGVAEGR